MTMTDPTVAIMSPGDMGHAQSSLELVDVKSLSTGVVLLTYRPDRRLGTRPGA